MKNIKMQVGKRYLIQTELLGTSLHEKTLLEESELAYNFGYWQLKSEFDKYNKVIEELQDKPVKEITKPTSKDYLAEHKACGIKVGDMVTVVRKAHDHEGGWNNDWVKSVDKYVGNSYKVLSDDKYSGFRIGSDGESWRFPYFVLEKVEPLFTLPDDNGVEQPVYEGQGVWWVNMEKTILGSGTASQYIVKDGMKGFSKIFLTKTLAEKWLEEYKKQQEPKPFKRWRGEKYYFIDNNGYIKEVADNNFTYDKIRYKSGNYYQTQALAEQARDKQLLIQEIQDYCSELNGEVEWKPVGCAEFYAPEYTSNGWRNNKFLFNKHLLFKFKTAELCQKFIDKFGSKLDEVL